MIINQMYRLLLIVFLISINCGINEQKKEYDSRIIGSWSQVLKNGTLHHQFCLIDTSYAIHFYLSTLDTSKFAAFLDDLYNDWWTINDTLFLENIQDPDSSGLKRGYNKLKIYYNIIDTNTLQMVFMDSSLITLFRDSLCSKVDLE
jgi:hypothetical protein